MKWKLLVGARQRKEKKNNRRRIGARIENNIYGCASRRLAEIATTFFVPTSLILSALNFGKKSKYFNFDEKYSECKVVICEGDVDITMHKSIRGVIFAVLLPHQ